MFPCLFVYILWGHHASVIFSAQLELMSYFILVFFSGETFTDKTGFPEIAIRLFLVP